MKLLPVWIACCLLFAPIATAQNAAPASPDTANVPSLAELKAAGAQRSSYRQASPQPIETAVPQPRLAAFRQEIQPILQQTCVPCHGPELQEGNIRIDTLDPDLLHGDDVDWWLEVVAVLSKGEMPPADEAELADQDRSKIIEWLSTEIQTASTVRRAEQGRSSFRRMTRYEYQYALQDLLGVPGNFADNLPPESPSEDGFQNSSEMLHMTATQLAACRESIRQALRRAIVRGDQPPPQYWGVSMEDAAAAEWVKQDEQLARIREQHKNDPEKLAQELKRQTARFQARPSGAHYRNLTTGQTAGASWRYSGARYAWKPAAAPPEIPADFDHVAVIPPRQKLIVELGDTVPDEGVLRVRIRASRTSAEEQPAPSLQLEFGWQASNDSHASVRISDHDLAITAGPDQPEFYEWRIPLSEVYPRNSVRGVNRMGDLPSPSEYIKIVNSSVSGGDVQLDYVEITAPVYDQWPPASHTRIFFDSPHRQDETVYAREVLARFLTRAWRRPPTPAELDQKLAQFTRIRPQCDDFQDAMTEVLETVLASPRFLYLVAADDTDAESRTADFELATRLSLFLWCSTPDEELLDLAADGRLADREVLASQVRRMLADPKAERFSRHFVRQWLGMQLLDYLNVDRKAYPQFDPALKEAMQQEPVAFFQEMLQQNHSVLDFLHADYALVNERLAKHYGLSDVEGNHFRRVKLDLQPERGGLLTQAGLLAMNSDGKDSHPLKRGIWMLKSLLNDPPPPPPPAVPEIDLADPEIAKLTLKERIEDHRNHTACMSCHAKIDPWGIAFENFDAVGAWRTQVQGKPVDASSLLFNREKLDGVDGLKRYLLEHRQDQFARALVHKMTTFALGRPLTFADRAPIDQITAELRRQDDGLATLVQLIVASDLFSPQ
ncbi:DUF1592 domain-containing protein [Lignipirellula cremea]|uniref:Planctomycete cytochrome C n=1 Tax=Lignipirellula cremea TaxID=2528010 RepID=A0A518E4I5_9BACT|nr:DUF1592 domain-containing protein [Lignipirellula cremea]QDU99006.1 hypothetical protein Pla8534_69170 [Lignipirellula cremea]